MKNRFRQALPAISLSILLVVVLVAGCILSAPAIDPAAHSTGTAFRMPETAAAAGSFNITIDVNPSIGLTVTEGLVSAAQAFNDDGQALILTTETIGLTAEEAVRAIVSELLAEGYFGDSELQPHLIVTVANGDSQVGEDAAQVLEQAAADVLAGQAVDCEIKTAYIPDEIAAAAAENGLSAGRYVILDYIAKTTGISLEDAIAQYGALKIGELMDLFEGARDVFDAYNIAVQPEETSETDETSETSESEAAATTGTDGLTSEQLAQYQAALDAFHAELKAANDAFHAAFKQIKADTQAKIEAARATFKHVDREQYLKAMSDARDEMLSARREAIAVMKAAFRTAKANFKMAVADLGLDAEDLEDELDAIVENEADTDSEDLDEMLNELAEPLSENDEEDQNPTFTDDDEGSAAASQKPAETGERPSHSGRSDKNGDKGKGRG